ncbi:MAG: lysophospholipid acyltransferase family protein [Chloroflexota bacterium]
MTIADFVARQPQLTWRRRLMKSVLKPIGFRIVWDVTVTGTHNIPPTGGTILMMNHISAIDPVICIGAVDHRFVVPMSKIENTQHPASNFFLRWWGVYTIDRDTLDRHALQQSINLLKSGALILIAPEGTRHPEGLAPGKDGMTYIAAKSDAVIVPTALSYAQGWKDSLNKLHRHPLRVNFGRPFRLKTAGRKRIPRNEIAQMTTECMYQLALTVEDKSARGVYSDVENATTDCLHFLS